MKTKRTNVVMNPWALMPFVLASVLTSPGATATTLNACAARLAPDVPKATVGTGFNGSGSESASGQNASLSNVREDPTRILEQAFAGNGVGGVPAVRARSKGLIGQGGGLALSNADARLEVSMVPCLFNGSSFSVFEEDIEAELTLDYLLGTSIEGNTEQSTTVADAEVRIQSSSGHRGRVTDRGSLRDSNFRNVVEQEGFVGSATNDVPATLIPADISSYNYIDTTVTMLRGQISISIGFREFRDGEPGSLIMAADALGNASGAFFTELLFPRAGAVAFMDVCGASAASSFSGSTDGLGLYFSTGLFLPFGPRGECSVPSELPTVGPTDWTLIAFDQGLPPFIPTSLVSEVPEPGPLPLLFAGMTCVGLLRVTRFGSPA